MIMSSNDHPDQLNDQEVYGSDGYLQSLHFVLSLRIFRMKTREENISWELLEITPPADCDYYSFEKMIAPKCKKSL